MSIYRNFVPFYERLSRGSSGTGLSAFEIPCKNINPYGTSPGSRVTSQSLSLTPRELAQRAFWLSFACWKNLYSDKILRVSFNFSFRFFRVKSNFQFRREYSVLIFLQNGVYCMMKFIGTESSIPASYRILNFQKIRVPTASPQ